MTLDNNTDRMIKEAIQPLQKQIDKLKTELTKLKKKVSEINERPIYTNNSYKP